MSNRAEYPTVVITGGSAGVGRAAALAFARRGWGVALVARGRSRLDSAKREVERAGGRGLTVSADVADPDGLASSAECVISEWGRINVWINNAMATVFAPAEAITPAEFKRVAEVTYLGQVHGTLEALRHMRRQGGGTIVQVGSALAYRSIPLQSAYCAAKAAVREFTDSLRSELIYAGSSVRLTMVHLPAINTPQFECARSRLPRRPQPVPPIHQPEVAAEAIFRAAIEAPRELWVGTPTMEAIPGTMAAPGLLDRMMSSRAWDGQMTDEPARVRPDNLFEPVEGNFGAEGRFTREAKPSALSLSDVLVRGFAAAAAAGVAVGLVALAWNGGKRTAREPFLPDRIQRGAARQQEESP